MQIDNLKVEYSILIFDEFSKGILQKFFFELHQGDVILFMYKGYNYSIVVTKILVDLIGLIRDDFRCEVNKIVLAEISTELNWHTTLSKLLVQNRSMM